MPRPTLSASAKFMRPRARRVLPRERLFARLAPGDPPVIWVCAAPGAGKTALAASYCERSRARTLWYQIDAADADPASFFSCMSQAVAALAPTRSQALPLLPPEGSVDLAVFAATYFMACFSLLPAATVLVFDNLQSAPGEPLEAILGAAFEQLRDGLSVIVLSLAPPPASMARLIANGVIGLIGDEELRFTRAESDRVVQARMAVDESVRADLHERSEGWAAGLVLMLEHLGGNGMPAPASLDESQEAVFDYFTSGIFSRCSPEEQRALMLAAWLPRLTAPLAQALPGPVDLLRLLDRLHRRHLFVDRHPGREPSYGFHRLFRAFLRRQSIAGLTPRQRAEAADRVALRLAVDGQVEDAVTLYLDAGRWEPAQRLITRQARLLVAQGRWRTLLGWIQSLPSPLLDREPWLGYWLGACLVWVDPQAARAQLGRAHARFTAQGDLAGQVLAAGACSRACLLDTDWRALDPWIARLEALLDGDTSGLSPQTVLTGLSRLLYITLARCPGHPRLPVWAERTGALLSLAESPDEALLAGFSLLFFHTWTGQTARAEQVVRQIAPLAADPRASAIGRVYWWWAEANHLLTVGAGAQALATIDAALHLATRSGLSIAGVVRRHRVAHLLALGRDKEAASELRNLATAPRVEPYFELCAWLALLNGDARQALDEAQAALDLADERGRTWYRLLDLSLLVAICTTVGAADQAQRHLQQYREATRHMPGEFAVFQAAWLQAHAALARGDGTAAQGPLRQALEIGSRQRYRCFWGWNPATMAPLLSQALAQDIETGYCRELIRAHRLAPPAEPVPHWPWPVRILALGRFDVLIDDRPLRFEGKAQRKPLDLLKMLVASAEQPVAIERLVDWLWPDPDEGGRKAFDITVHRLRKLLGVDAAVHVADRHAGLDTQVVWVDAWELARQLESTLAVDPTAACPGPDDRAATRILALAAGPLLPEDDDAPWLLARRHRLSARLQQWALRRGAQLERLQQWDPAVHLYQRLVELDPLAELFYRRQMACLHAQGRRAEAIEVFCRCRQMLSITLGVAPAAETEALMRDLMAG